MPSKFEFADLKYSYSQQFVAEFIKDPKNFNKDDTECHSHFNKENDGSDEEEEHNHHHSNEKEFNFMDFIVLRQNSWMIQTWRFLEIFLCVISSNLYIYLAQFGYHVFDDKDHKTIVD